MGSISGTVFDIPNESTFAGAIVELLMDESVVATISADEVGNYSFTELQLGIYTVRASAPEYFPDTSEPVELTEESPDAADVNLGLVFAIG